MPSCCDEVSFVCVIDDNWFFGEVVFVVTPSNHDKKYSKSNVAFQGQLVHSELFDRIWTPRNFNWCGWVKSL